MLRAKKGNRVVRIPDEKKKEYQALGYTISDMSGNTIYEPKDPGKEAETLKKELEAVKEENKALISENITLKEKLKEASAYAEKSDKRIEELEEKLKEASKPAKTSRTKKAETADKAPNAVNEGLETDRQRNHRRVVFNA